MGRAAATAVGRVEVKAVATRHGRACRVGTQNRNRKRGLDFEAQLETEGDSARNEEADLPSPFPGAQDPAEGLTVLPPALDQSPSQTRGPVGRSPNCWGAALSLLQTPGLFHIFENCVSTSSGRCNCVQACRADRRLRWWR